MRLSVRPGARINRSLGFSRAVESAPDTTEGNYLFTGVVSVKPDTTGSSHRGRPASDFSTFPLFSNIIYIPSLGVKVQSDAHYSSKKDNFPLIRLAGG